MRQSGSSSGANPKQYCSDLKMSERRIYVGTAAWAIPKQYDDAFPREGSHLVRYASRFDGVEINSSFYRPHRLSTYQRCADDVPDHFRFAVKMPKTITHEGRLRDVDEPLQRFLGKSLDWVRSSDQSLSSFPPSLIRVPVIRAAGLGWFTTVCMGRPKCTTRCIRRRSSPRPLRRLRSMQRPDEQHGASSTIQPLLLRPAMR
jgi:uncharacterized protein DUF72